MFNQATPQMGGTNFQTGAPAFNAAPQLQRTNATALPAAQPFNQFQQGQRPMGSFQQPGAMQPGGFTGATQGFNQAPGQLGGNTALPTGGFGMTTGAGPTAAPLNQFAQQPPNPAGATGFGNPNANPLNSFSATPGANPFTQGMPAQTTFNTPMAGGMGGAGGFPGSTMNPGTNPLAAANPIGGMGGSNFSQPGMTGGFGNSMGQMGQQPGMNAPTSGFGQQVQTAWGQAGAVGAPGAQQRGTAGQQIGVTTARDATGAFKVQSVACNTQFGKAPIEELRLQDYQANNGAMRSRGQAGAMPGMMPGGFNNPQQPGMGMPGNQFQAAPAPPPSGPGGLQSFSSAVAGLAQQPGQSSLFPQGATSAFGQTAPNPLAPAGSTTSAFPGLAGNPNPTGANPAQGVSLFASNVANTAGSSLFQTAPQQPGQVSSPFRPPTGASSLFSQTPAATTPSFGGATSSLFPSNPAQTATQPSPNLFAPNPAMNAAFGNSSLFRGAAGSSLFPSAAPNAAPQSFASPTAIPGQMPMMQQGQVSSNSAYTDPHGLQGLFPGGIPQEFRNRVRQITKEPESIIDKIRKHERASASPHSYEIPSLKKYNYSDDSMTPSSPSRPSPNLLNLSRSNSSELSFLTVNDQFKSYKFVPVSDAPNARFKLTGPTSLYRARSAEIYKPVTNEIDITMLAPDQVKIMGNFSKNDTVDDLKKLACKRLQQYEPSQMLLTHKNSVLKTSDTLRSLQLTEDDVIDIIINHDSSEEKVKVADPSLLPKLTDKSYTITPSLEELSKMSEAQLKAVHHFSVRNDHGSIIFSGDTDVRELDLDDLIIIRKREVEVYPDECHVKHPKGEKLNKSATITMLNAYPRDEFPDETMKDKLKAYCDKQGAQFIDYNPEEGVWVFKVKHF